MMSFSGVKPQFLWHVNREYDSMRIFELLGVGAATFPDYSHKNRIRSGLGLNVTDMGHSMGAPMGPQDWSPFQNDPKWWSYGAIPIFPQS